MYPSTAVTNAEQGTVATLMTCAHCGQTGLRRVERTGFLQNRIYPLFGRFPWECPHCRKITMLKLRGRKRRVKPEDVGFLEGQPEDDRRIRRGRASDTRKPSP